jgi:carbonic anhydrase
MDAEDALKKLKEGNARFISGKPSAKNLPSQRQALVSGQKPYAIILTCSDSRVAPEHIFDAGLGEIFVIRNAGNISEPIALGSIEYAAEHLGSLLLLVMGHESCGAVKAACSSDSAPGNIGAIVRDMQEAVKTGGKDPSKVVPENVKIVLRKIREKSGILSNLEKEGKLKIVGAVYSLASGEVSYL